METDQQYEETNQKCKETNQQIEALLIFVNRGNGSKIRGNGPNSLGNRLKHWDYKFLKKSGNGPKIWGSRLINWDFRSFVKSGNGSKKYIWKPTKKRWNFKYWKKDSKYSEIPQQFWTFWGISSNF